MSGRKSKKNQKLGSSRRGPKGLNRNIEKDDDEDGFQQIAESEDGRDTTSYYHATQFDHPPSSSIEQQTSALECPPHARGHKNSLMETELPERKRKMGSTRKSTGSFKDERKLDHVRTTEELDEEYVTQPTTSTTEEQHASLTEEEQSSFPSDLSLQTKSSGFGKESGTTLMFAVSENKEKYTIHHQEITSHSHEVVSDVPIDEAMGPSVHSIAVKVAERDLLREDSVMLNEPKTLSHQETQIASTSGQKRRMGSTRRPLGGKNGENVGVQEHSRNMTENESKAEVMGEAKFKMSEEMAQTWDDVARDDPSSHTESPLLLSQSLLSDRAELKEPGVSAETETMNQSVAFPLVDSEKPLPETFSHHGTPLLNEALDFKFGSHTEDLDVLNKVLKEAGSHLSDNSQHVSDTRKDTNPSYDIRDVNIEAKKVVLKQKEEPQLEELALHDQESSLSQHDIATLDNNYDCSMVQHIVVGSTSFDMPVSNISHAEPTTTNLPHEMRDSVEERQEIHIEMKQENNVCNVASVTCDTLTVSITEEDEDPHILAMRENENMSNERGSETEYAFEMTDQGDVSDHNVTQIIMDVRDNEKGGETSTETIWISHQKPCDVSTENKELYKGQEHYSSNISLTHSPTQDDADKMLENEEVRKDKKETENTAVNDVTSKSEEIFSFEVSATDRGSHAHQQLFMQSPDQEGYDLHENVKEKSEKEEILFNVESENAAFDRGNERSEGTDGVKEMDAAPVLTLDVGDADLHLEIEAQNKTFDSTNSEADGTEENINGASVIGNTVEHNMTTESDFLQSSPHAHKEALNVFENAKKEVSGETILKQSDINIVPEVFHGEEAHAKSSPIVHKRKMGSTRRPLKGKKGQRKEIEHHAENETLDSDDMINVEKETFRLESEPSPDESTLHSLKDGAKEQEMEICEKNDVGPVEGSVSALLQSSCSSDLLSEEFTAISICHITESQTLTNINLESQENTGDAESVAQEEEKDLQLETNSQNKKFDLTTSEAEETEKNIQDVSVTIIREVEVIGDTVTVESNMTTESDFLQTSPDAHMEALKVSKNAEKEVSGETNTIPEQSDISIIPAGSHREETHSKSSPVIHKRKMGSTRRPLKGNTGRRKDDEKEIFNLEDEPSPDESRCTAVSICDISESQTITKIHARSQENTGDVERAPAEGDTESHSENKTFDSACEGEATEENICKASVLVREVKFIGDAIIVESNMTTESDLIQNNTSSEAKLEALKVSDNPVHDVLGETDEIPKQRDTTIIPEDTQKEEAHSKFTVTHKRKMGSTRRPLRGNKGQRKEIEHHGANETHDSDSIINAEKNTISLENEPSPDESTLQSTKDGAKKQEMEICEKNDVGLVEGSESALLQSSCSSDLVSEESTAISTCHITESQTLTNINVESQENTGDAEGLAAKEDKDLQLEIDTQETLKVSKNSDSEDLSDALRNSQSEIQPENKMIELTSEAERTEDTICEASVSVREDEFTLDTVIADSNMTIQSDLLQSDTLNEANLETLKVSKNTESVSAVTDSVLLVQDDVTERSRQTDTFPEQSDIDIIPEYSHGEETHSKSSPIVHKRKMGSTRRPLRGNKGQRKEIEHHDENETHDSDGIINAEKQTISLENEPSPDESTLQSTKDGVKKQEMEICEKNDVGPVEGSESALLQSSCSSDLVSEEFTAISICHITESQTLTKIDEVSQENTGDAERVAAEEDKDFRLEIDSQNKTFDSTTREAEETEKNIQDISVMLIREVEVIGDTVTVESNMTTESDFLQTSPDAHMEALKVSKNAEKDVSGETNTIPEQSDIDIIPADSHREETHSKSSPVIHKRKMGSTRRPLKGNTGRRKEIEHHDENETHDSDGIINAEKNTISLENEPSPDESILQSLKDGAKEQEMEICEKNDVGPVEGSESALLQSSCSSDLVSEEFTAISTCHITESQTLTNINVESQENTGDAERVAAEEDKDFRLEIDSQNKTFDSTTREAEETEKNIHDTSVLVREVEVIGDTDTVESNMTTESDFLQTSPDAHMEALNVSKNAEKEVSGETNTIPEQSDISIIPADSHREETHSKSSPVIHKRKMGSTRRPLKGNTGRRKGHDEKEIFNLEDEPSPDESRYTAVSICDISESQTISKIHAGSHENTGDVDIAPAERDTESHSENKTFDSTAFEGEATEENICKASVLVREVDVIGDTVGSNMSAESDFHQNSDANMELLKVSENSDSDVSSDPIRNSQSEIQPENKMIELTSEAERTEDTICEASVSVREDEFTLDTVIADSNMTIQSDLLQSDTLNEANLETLKVSKNTESVSAVTDSVLLVQDDVTERSRQTDTFPEQSDIDIIPEYSHGEETHSKSSPIVHKRKMGSTRRPLRGNKGQRKEIEHHDENETHDSDGIINAEKQTISLENEPSPDESTLQSTKDGVKKQEMEICEKNDVGPVEGSESALLQSSCSSDLVSEEFTAISICHITESQTLTKIDEVSQENTGDAERVAAEEDKDFRLEIDSQNKTFDSTTREAEETEKNIQDISVMLIREVEVIGDTVTVESNMTTESDFLQTSPDAHMEALKVSKNAEKDVSGETNTIPEQSDIDIIPEYSHGEETHSKSSPIVHKRKMGSTRRPLRGNKGQRKEIEHHDENETHDSDGIINAEKQTISLENEPSPDESTLQSTKDGVKKQEMEICEKNDVGPVERSESALLQSSCSSDLVSEEFTAISTCHITESQTLTKIDEVSQENTGDAERVAAEEDKDLRLEIDTQNKTFDSTNREAEETEKNILDTSVLVREVEVIGDTDTVESNMTTESDFLQTSPDAHMEALNVSKNAEKEVSGETNTIPEQSDISIIPADSHREETHSKSSPVIHKRKMGSTRKPLKGNTGRRKDDEKEIFNLEDEPSPDESRYTAVSICDISESQTITKMYAGSHENTGDVDIAPAEGDTESHSQNKSFDSTAFEGEVEVREVEVIGDTVGSNMSAESDFHQNSDANMETLKVSENSDSDVSSDPIRNSQSEIQPENKMIELTSEAERTEDTICEASVSVREDEFTLDTVIADSNMTIQSDLLQSDTLNEANLETLKVSKNTESVSAVTDSVLLVQDDVTERSRQTDTFPEQSDIDVIPEYSHGEETHSKSSPIVHKRKMGSTRRPLRGNKGQRKDIEHHDENETHDSDGIINAEKNTISLENEPSPDESTLQSTKDGVKEQEMEICEKNDVGLVEGSESALLQSSCSSDLVSEEFTAISTCHITESQTLTKIDEVSQENTGDAERVAAEEDKYFRLEIDSQNKTFDSTTREAEETEKNILDTSVLVREVEVIGDTDKVESNMTIESDFLQTSPDAHIEALNVSKNAEKEVSGETNTIPEQSDISIIPADSHREETHSKSSPVIHKRKLGSTRRPLKGNTGRRKGHDEKKIFSLEDEPSPDESRYTAVSICDISESQTITKIHAGSHENTGDVERAPAEGDTESHSENKTFDSPAFEGEATEENICKASVLVREVDVIGDTVGSNMSAESDFHQNSDANMETLKVSENSDSDVSSDPIRNSQSEIQPENKMIELTSEAERTEDTICEASVSVREDEFTLDTVIADSNMTIQSDLLQSDTLNEANLETLKVSKNTESVSAVTDSVLLVQDDVTERSRQTDTFPEQSDIDIIPEYSHGEETHSKSSPIVHKRKMGSTRRPLRGNNGQRKEIEHHDENETFDSDSVINAEKETFILENEPSPDESTLQSTKDGVKKQEMEICEKNDVGPVEGSESALLQSSCSSDLVSEEFTAISTCHITESQTLTKINEVSQENTGDAERVAAEEDKNFRLEIDTQNKTFDLATSEAEETEKNIQDISVTLIREVEVIGDTVTMESNMTTESDFLQTSPDADLEALKVSKNTESVSAVTDSVLLVQDDVTERSRQTDTFPEQSDIDVIPEYSHGEETHSKSSPIVHKRKMGSTRKPLRGNKGQRKEIEHHDENETHDSDGIINAEKKTISLENEPSPDESTLQSTKDGVKKQEMEICEKNDVGPVERSESALLQSSCSSDLVSEEFTAISICHITESQTLTKIDEVSQENTGDAERVAAEEDKDFRLEIDSQNKTFDSTTREAEETEKNIQDISVMLIREVEVIGDTVTVESNMTTESDFLQTSPDAHMEALKVSKNAEKDVSGETNTIPEQSDISIIPADSHREETHSKSSPVIHKRKMGSTRRPLKGNTGRRKEIEHHDENETHDSDVIINAEKNTISLENEPSPDESTLQSLKDGAKEQEMEICEKNDVGPVERSESALLQSSCSSDLVSEEFTATSTCHITESQTLTNINVESQENTGDAERVAAEEDKDFRLEIDSQNKTFDSTTREAEETEKNIHDTSVLVREVEVIGDTDTVESNMTTESDFLQTSPDAHMEALNVSKNAEKEVSGETNTIPEQSDISIIPADSHREETHSKSSPVIHERKMGSTRRPLKGNTGRKKGHDEKEIFNLEDEPSPDESRYTAVSICDISESQTISKIHAGSHENTGDVDIAPAERDTESHSENKTFDSTAFEGEATEENICKASVLVREVDVIGDTVGSNMSAESDFHQNSDANMELLKVSENSDSDVSSDPIRNSQSEIQPENKMIELTSEAERTEDTICEASVSVREDEFTLDTVIADSNMTIQSDLLQSDTLNEANLETLKVSKNTESVSAVTDSVLLVQDDVTERSRQTDTFPEQSDIDIIPEYSHGEETHSKSSPIVHKRKMGSTRRPLRGNKGQRKEIEHHDENETHDSDGIINAEKKTISLENEPSPDESTLQSTKDGSKEQEMEICEKNDVGPVEGSESALLQSSCSSDLVSEEFTAISTCHITESQTLTKIDEVSQENTGDAERVAAEEDKDLRLEIDTQNKTFDSTNREAEETEKNILDTSVLVREVEVIGDTDTVESNMTTESDFLQTSPYAHMEALKVSKNAEKEVSGETNTIPEQSDISIIPADSHREETHSKSSPVIHKRKMGSTRKPLKGNKGRRKDDEKEIFNLEDEPSPDESKYTAVSICDISESQTITKMYAGSHENTGDVDIAPAEGDTESHSENKSFDSTAFEGEVEVREVDVIGDTVGSNMSAESDFHQNSDANMETLKVSENSDSDVSSDPIRNSQSEIQPENKMIELTSEAERTEDTICEASVSVREDEFTLDTVIADSNMTIQSDLLQSDTLNEANLETLKVSKNTESVSAVTDSVLLVQDDVTERSRQTDTFPEQSDIDVIPEYSHGEETHSKSSPIVHKRKMGSTRRPLRGNKGQRKEIEHHDENETHDSDGIINAEKKTISLENEPSPDESILQSLKDGAKEQEMEICEKNDVGPVEGSESALLQSSCSSDLVSEEFTAISTCHITESQTLTKIDEVSQENTGDAERVAAEEEKDFRLEIDTQNKTFDLATSEAEETEKNIHDTSVLVREVEVIGDTDTVESNMTTESDFLQTSPDAHMEALNVSKNAEKDVSGETNTIPEQSDISIIPADSHREETHSKSSPVIHKRKMGSTRRPLKGNTGRRKDDEKEIFNLEDEPSPDESKYTAVSICDISESQTITKINARSHENTGDVERAPAEGDTESHSENKTFDSTAFEGEATEENICKASVLIREVEFIGDAIIVKSNMTTESDLIQNNTSSEAKLEALKVSDNPVHEVLGETDEIPKQRDTTIIPEDTQKEEAHSKFTVTHKRKMGSTRRPLRGKNGQRKEIEHHDANETLDSDGIINAEKNTISLENEPSPDESTLQSTKDVLKEQEMEICEKNDVGPVEGSESALLQSSCSSDLVSEEFTAISTCHITESQTLTNINVESQENTGDAERVAQEEDKDLQLESDTQNKTFDLATSEAEETEKNIQDVSVTIIREVEVIGDTVTVESNMTTESDFLQTSPDAHMEALKVSKNAEKEVSGETNTIPEQSDISIIPADSHREETHSKSSPVIHKRKMGSTRRPLKGNTGRRKGHDEKEIFNLEDEPSPDESKYTAVSICDISESQTITKMYAGSHENTGDVDIAPAERDTESHSENKTIYSPAFEGEATEENICAASALDRKVELIGDAVIVENNMTTESDLIQNYTSTDAKPEALISEITENEISGKTDTISKQSVPNIIPEDLHGDEVHSKLSLNVHKRKMGSTRRPLRGNKEQRKVRVESKENNGDSEGVSEEEDTETHSEIQNRDNVVDHNVTQEIINIRDVEDEERKTTKTVDMSVQELCDDLEQRSDASQTQTGPSQDDTGSHLLEFQERTADFVRDSNSLSDVVVSDALLMEETQIHASSNDVPPTKVVEMNPVSKKSMQKRKMGSTRKRGKRMVNDEEVEEKEGETENTTIDDETTNSEEKLTLEEAITGSTVHQQLFSSSADKEGHDIQDIVCKSDVQAENSEQNDPNSTINPELLIESECSSNVAADMVSDLPLGDVDTYLDPKQSVIPKESHREDQPNLNPVVQKRKMGSTRKTFRGNKGQGRIVEFKKMDGDSEGMTQEQDTEPHLETSARKTEFDEEFEQNFPVEFSHPVASSNMFPEPENGVKEVSQNIHDLFEVSEEKGMDNTGNDSNSLSEAINLNEGTKDNFFLTISHEDAHQIVSEPEQTENTHEVIPTQELRATQDDVVHENNSRKIPATQEKRRKMGSTRRNPRGMLGKNMADNEDVLGVAEDRETKKAVDDLEEALSTSQSKEVSSVSTTDLESEMFIGATDFKVENDHLHSSRPTMPETPENTLQICDNQLVNADVTKHPQSETVTTEKRRKMGSTRKNLREGKIQGKRDGYEDIETEDTNLQMSQDSEMSLVRENVGQQTTHDYSNQSEDSLLSEIERALNKTSESSSSCDWELIIKEPNPDDLANAPDLNIPENSEIKSLQPMPSAHSEPNSPGGRRRKMGSTRKNPRQQLKAEREDEDKEDREIDENSKANKQENKDLERVEVSVVHNISENRLNKEYLDVSSAHTSSNQLEESTNPVSQEKTSPSTKRKFGSRRANKGKQGLGGLADSDFGNELEDGDHKPDSSEVKDKLHSDDLAVCEPCLTLQPENQPASEQRNMEAKNEEAAPKGTVAGLVSLDQIIKHDTTGAKQTVNLKNRISDTEVVQFNVVMVGNSCVGKTSFIRRFHEGQFTEDYGSTIGVDTCIQTVALPDRIVKLQIWDTAGQERFHSITTQVFHKADGLLLMYEITCSKSFISVRDWISQARERAPDDVIMMLLGNKNDSVKREVQIQEGADLAREYNIHFMECSAATGANVSESMRSLAELLVQRKSRKEKHTTLRREPAQKKSGCC